MTERFHTTVTERGSFRSCHRKWFYENVRRLRLRGNVTWYLIYGDVMHEALDAYYRPTSSRSTRPPRKLSTALDAFMAAWNVENEKLKAEYGPLYSMGIEEEWFRYQELGKQTLIYYDRFDRADPFFTKVVAVGVEERSFIEILEPSERETFKDHPLLSGRIDLIFQRDDGYHGWDHKNLSSKASDAALDLDDQLTGYSYIWWRLEGKPLKGFWYNVLLKDPPKPPKVLVNGKLSTDKSQRTTYDLYVDALKELQLPRSDYKEMLKYLKEKGWTQFFQRLGPVVKNKDELLSFERRLYHEYIDMDGALKYEDFRYPNPSQYTCPGCPIMPICLAHEERSDVDWIIEDRYAVAPPRHQIPEGV